MNDALRKVLKRLHYPLEIMLTCVRWYVAYPLSLRHIEAMMHERGVFVDHTTIHRCSLKILPVLAAVCRSCERRVGSSWCMDETYVLVGLPDKITIDKSGANTAAIRSIQADTGAPIELRHVKYSNNIVEQDHRAIKRIIRPMLGFHSFHCACSMHRLEDEKHMLVLLEPGDYDDWLNCRVEDAPEFFKRFPAERLKDAPTPKSVKAATQASLPDM